MNSSFSKYLFFKPLQTNDNQSDVLFLYKQWSQQLFTLELENGSITMMPKPPGGYTHREFAKFLHHNNIDVVVSLLEEHESLSFDLQNQSSDLEEYGIKFFNFPVRDHETPTFMIPFKSQVVKLVGLLKENKNIAIHCYAGIGRTGILSSCLLMHFGYNVDSSLIKLSKARKLKVPETLGQISWLHQYEQHL